MLKRLKKIGAVIALGAIMMLTPAAATALPAPVDLVARSSLAQQACNGLTTIDGSENCDAQSKDAGITGIISSVVRILSYIIGLLSVIFVLIAAFKYITAAGDSNKISSAKTTLIYALIGLVIVALAQFLVNFAFSAAQESVAILLTATV